MLQKSFSNIPVTSLSVLHNYFDGLKKLFSHLYLTKFSDTLTKLLSMFNQSQF